MDQYKYDIALSFLARDESIAKDIYNRLKDRYNVFIYSEQQKTLAGKDGEAAFKQVFETEAKLVVVLYRPEWGSTPWTRMEETGIRDRAYKFGYGFTTFVALTDTPQVPDWFPKQRLYVGYERLGLDTVVTVIDARAQEAEIPSRELSVIEQAQILQKRRLFEAERVGFLSSYEGVQSAQNSEKKLRLLVEEKFTELSVAAPSLRIEIHTNDAQLGISGVGPALLIGYRQVYGNTLTDSKFKVELFSFGPPMKHRSYYEQPQRLRSMELYFDRTEDQPTCWRFNGRHYSEEQTAELIVKVWLDAQPDGSGGTNSQRKFRR
ncbi:hypothetical protein [uncultured Hydrogenophaga sp.]|uniref:hypothetical protein n=1 Tax=uncultured Hydrogenophaga sp. TaxID=199683 RepID=UPI0026601B6F|nr:hypothetical protein [uncultured Hydrogenophaga sp.]